VGSDRLCQQCDTLEGVHRELGEQLEAADPLLEC
jgi:hypothetical protein